MLPRTGTARTTRATLALTMAVVALALGACSDPLSDLDVHGDAGLRDGDPHLVERERATRADAPSRSDAERRGCDEGYEGACLDPGAKDYDCAGGAGNGPMYVEGPVDVVGDDRHELDRDGDGIGCERH